MTDWRDDKHWSDRFVPEIKAIAGRYLLMVAPEIEDIERNSDLITLHMNTVRIACRIRRSEYIQYADEFTIRCHRAQGGKTELEKIIEGWGDYLFYGIADTDEQRLQCWALLDLRVFRTWWSNQLLRLPRGAIPGTLHYNRDGSSSFLAFRYSDLPANFVIARQAAKHNDVEPRHE